MHDFVVDFNNKFPRIGGFCKIFDPVLSLNFDPLSFFLIIEEGTSSFGKIRYKRLFIDTCHFPVSISREKFS